MILPVLFLACSMGLRTVRGPFYAAADPDYAYLMNSLNVVNGWSPRHFDHPGTPVQVFGGLVAQAAHRGVPGDLAVDVVARPEFYLGVINGAMVVLICLALYAGGWLVWVVSRQMALALLFEGSLFLSATPLMYSVKVCPEPFLTLSALLFGVLVLCVLKYGLYGRSLRFAFLFSVLSGFALATKITAIPLVFASFVVLHGLRSRLLFVLGTAASFLVFTFPIRDKYVHVWNWLVSITTHVGRYGQSRSGVLEGPAFIHSFAAYLMSEPAFTLVLAVSVVFVAWALVARKGKGIELHVKVIIALAAAQFIQLVMAAKHPGSRAYLMPSLAMSGAALVVMFDYLDLAGLKKAGRLLGAATVLALCLGVGSLPCIYRKAYWRSSFTEYSVISALKFGDWWSGEKYTAPIRERYGEQ